MPLRLYAVNDPSLYAARIKNLDPANSLGLLVENANGVAVLDAKKTGFTYSSDGANSGLVPVSQSVAETISGVKTHSAAVIFNSRTTQHRATATASTGTLTLPTDGVQIPITGTQTITSIVATGLAGLEVTLEFQSADCRVAISSTMKLEGDFVSGSAGATLTLYCDGTNWIEKGRRKARVLGCQLTKSADQSIANNTFTAITWTTAQRNTGGLFWTSGTHILAPYSGVYLLTGNVSFDNNATGYRQVAWDFDGSGARIDLATLPTSSGSIGSALAFADEITLTAGQYVEIYGKQNSGGSLNVLGTDLDGTHVNWRYLGA